MSEDIKLELIDTESGTQSREKPLDYNTVDKYAERMIEGDQFPPIDLYFDGKRYYPSDGHQRIAARRKAYSKTHFTEFETIPANVTKGTKRDAILASTAANLDHGLGRTGADIRHAVETLLRDEEWAKFSDREIGRRVKMSNVYVGNIRKELSATVKHLQSTVRIGADGREIDTASIGRQAKHWGETAASFWAKVSELNLDKHSILEKIQPGAAQLTDLTMTKDEAMAALDQIATEPLVAAFPVGSFVYHKGIDVVYEITGHRPRILYGLDLQSRNEKEATAMLAEGCTIATQEQIDAYTHPPFPVDTPVLVVGNNTPGKVVAVKATQVLVSRKNTNDRENNFHWAKLEDVSLSVEGEPSESNENELSSGGNLAFTDPTTLYNVEPSDDPNVERARQIALAAIGETMSDAERRMHGSSSSSSSQQTVSFGGGAEWLDWKTQKSRRLKFSTDQVAVTLKLEDGEHFYRFNVVRLMRWKLDQAEKKESVSTEFKTDDWVRTSNGFETQIANIEGKTIWLKVGNLKTWNGSVVATEAWELTKIDPPPQEAPVCDANGVQLAIGDTVINSYGQHGVIRKLKGSLVYMEGQADTAAMLGGFWTKVDSVQPGDDQATDDELDIDEQLASQVINEDKAVDDSVVNIVHSFHLSDPDLQKLMDRFTQRFLEGSTGDAETLLSDIQDCMSYLRGCQETLNLEIEGRGQVQR